MAEHFSGSYLLNVFFSGLFLSAFCTELWEYYAAISLTFLELAKYGVIRSLLSKCVDKDETGKIFSAAGILAAIVPFAANPTIRQRYKRLSFLNMIDNYQKRVICVVKL